MNGNKKAIWPGWETVRLIGRGSFGEVYEIRRQVFDDTEKAALKVISIPQNDGDIEEMYSDGYGEDDITSTFQSHLKSIVAEYSLMRRLNGKPNIVHCDDVRYEQHSDGIGWDIFIKMELLLPLSKEITGDVPEDKVIKVAKDMCNALELCRQQNIVHRDIKPQNIFVSEDGDYKLGDFGIAKTVEKTMGGTKIGTYKYMAPEVYNNQSYGTKADLYSLGLVLYWMLNERRVPFMPLPPTKLTTGMEEQARLRRFSGEEIPAPKHGSEELKRIVLKACAFDPKDRYETAGDMLVALNAIGEKQVHIVIPPTPASVPESELVVPATASAPELEPIEPTPVPDVDKGAEEERTVAGKVEKKKRGKVALLGGLAAALALVVGIWISGAGDKSPDEQGKAVQKPAVETTLPAETLPIQVELSEWVDTLPEYVTSADYVIEEQTLYSTQKLEKTTSTESDKLEGWTLVDTIANPGEYGPWSEWSAESVSESDTRNVETQERYRYRTKETTTSNSMSKSGWELYETTYSWGDYGNWSSWSESEISQTDSRSVESKLQHRYRDVSTVTSDNSSLNGQLPYDQTTSYGEWGAWQDTPLSSSNSLEVETRQVESGKRYYLDHWCQKSDSGQLSGWYEEKSGYTHHVLGWFSTLDQFKLTFTSQKYPVYNCLQHACVNGLTAYYLTNEETTYKTQYRSRTITTTYFYRQYGGWSDWSDTNYAPSSTREIETRTVYRYRDRQKIPVYHFYHWGNWSGWSTKLVSENNSREVETKTYYRYQDKITETTYCFERWSDWSAYTTEVASESEEQKVQTKKQYRYRSKTADEK